MPLPPHLHRVLATFAILLTLGTGGCATRPPADEPEALEQFLAEGDPLEPTNRVLFRVHEAADQAVLEPVARGYRAAVPSPVRTGIRNLLGNLGSPVVLLNDILQGDGRRAEITLGRFMINSTLGLGGLIDVASMMGVPGHSSDFGQTLGVWGVGSGPYLFVPLLGPSNPRDLAGFVVDLASNPFIWFGQGPTVDTLNWTWAGTWAVDTREAALDAVEEVRRTSLDPYATIRSASRQRREAEIEGRTARLPPLAPASDSLGAPDPELEPQR